jgi:hypothetical protein
MLPAQPLDLFDQWMADVIRADLPEPTAMVLATTSADLRPRARMVLLKSSGPDGFTFYTNRTSRKASDLAEVPEACLLFPWHALHRQVIIEGTVGPLSTADSEPYFHSRPRVDGPVDPRRTRGQVLRAGTALARGHRGTDAGVLGRLPPDSRPDGVLAGSRESFARPVPLLAGGLNLDRQSPLPLI